MREVRPADPGDAGSVGAGNAGSVGAGDAGPVGAPPAAVGDEGSVGVGHAMGGAPPAGVGDEGSVGVGQARSVGVGHAVGVARPARIGEVVGEARPERMPAGWHTAGSVCVVREPVDADADALAALRAPDVVSEFEDYGDDAVLVPPATPPEELGPSARVFGRGTVVDVLDGSVLGLVSWHVVRYGPTSGSEAVNIGISLLPQGRGRGIGTQAQRLLAATLVRTFGVARVEAATDVRNRAEQRSLEKAGFTREGVLRAAQERRGVHHDLVLYSLLASEL